MSKDPPFTKHAELAAGEMEKTLAMLTPSSPPPAEASKKHKPDCAISRNWSGPCTCHLWTPAPLPEEPPSGENLTHSYPGQRHAELDAFHARQSRLSDLLDALIFAANGGINDASPSDNQDVNTDLARAALVALYNRQREARLADIEAQVITYSRQVASLESQLERLKAEQLTQLEARALLELESDAAALYQRPIVVAAFAKLRRLSQSEQTISREEK